jgi:hypothetical protein
LKILIQYAPGIEYIALTFCFSPFRGNACLMSTEKTEGHGAGNSVAFNLERSTCPADTDTLVLPEQAAARSPGWRAQA